MELPLLSTKPVGYGDKATNTECIHDLEECQQEEHEIDNEEAYSQHLDHSHPFTSTSRTQPPSTPGFILISSIPQPTPCTLIDQVTPVMSS